MTNRISKLIVTGAAAALAFTPVAAQANTRAGDTGAYYTSSVSQAGQRSAPEGSELVGVSQLFIGLLVGLFTSGLIVIAADLDDKNQSHGCN